MTKIRAKHYIITEYWHEYYCDKHCTLCGNSGTIHTTGVKTAAGIPVGRDNLCICPNGQVLRKAGVPPDPVAKPISKEFGLSKLIEGLGTVEQEVEWHVTRPTGYQVRISKPEIIKMAIEVLQKVQERGL